MATPQSKFEIGLPTHDVAVPPNAITVGEITQVDVEITVAGVKSVYSSPVSPTAPVGSIVEVPFTALSPPFVPVPGTSYSADAYFVNSAGNGVPSVVISWTQVAATGVPDAPTSFSVA